MMFLINPDLNQPIKKSRFWLVIILLLAFVLRVYGLGDVAIDNDEGIVYNRWISESFRTIIVDDLVLNNHTFAQIQARVSILFLGDSLFALRWPSVCLSVLGIVFIYKMTSRLFGENAGVVGASLLALSPYSIFFCSQLKWIYRCYCFPPLDIPASLVGPSNRSMALLDRD